MNFSVIVAEVGLNSFFREGERLTPAEGGGSRRLWVQAVGQGEVQVTADGDEAVAKALAPEGEEPGEVGGLKLHHEEAQAGEGVDASEEAVDVAFGPHLAEAGAEGRAKDGGPAEPGAQAGPEAGPAAAAMAARWGQKFTKS